MDYDTNNILVRQVIQDLVTRIPKDKTNENVRRILEPKNVKNAEFNIVLGRGESLVRHPIGALFNISLVSDAYDYQNIWDLINITRINTAQYTIPGVNTTPLCKYTMHRCYTSSDRSVGFNVPPEVIRYFCQKFSRRYVPSALEGHDGGVVENEMRKGIEETGRALWEQFVEKLGACHASMEKGVTQEAFMTVLEKSTDLAIAQSSEYLRSCIAGDTRSSFFRGELELNLEEEIVRRMQGNVYALQKDPAAFIHTLVCTGKENLLKVARGPSPYTIETDDGSKLPVSGVLVLAKRTYDKLMSQNNSRWANCPRIFGHGTLHGVKKVYYKPTSHITANKSNNVGIVETFYDEVEEKMPRADPSSLIEGIEIAKGVAPLDRPGPRPIGSNGDSLVKMTRIGEALLSRSPLPEFPKQRRTVLYGADIHRSCPYFVSCDAQGTTAVLVTCYPEDEPASVMATNPRGLSPGGDSQQKVLFHARVGEVRPMRGEEWHQWTEKIRAISGGSPAAGANGRQVIDGKDLRSAVFAPDTVKIYTGWDMTNGVLEVDPDTACTVFANPDMWDPTQQMDVLNQNYQKYDAERNPRSEDTAGLKSALENMARLASTRDDIVTRVWKKRGYDVWCAEPHRRDPAMIELQKIELMPMYDLVFNIAERKFTARRRLARHNFYNMNPGTHAIRKLQVLSKLSLPAATKINELLNACRAIHALPENLEDETVKDDDNWLYSGTQRPLFDLAEALYEFAKLNVPHWESNQAMMNLGRLGGGGDPQILNRTDGSRQGKLTMMVVLVVLPILQKAKIRVNAPSMVTAAGNHLNLEPDKTIQVARSDELVLDMPEIGFFTPASLIHLSAIASDEKMTFMERAATLIMMYQKVGVSELVAETRAGFATGFSVDFFNVQTLYAENASYAEQGAFEHLLVTRNEHSGDENQGLDIKIKVKNYASGNGIRMHALNVPFATPSPKIENLKDATGRGPLVCVESFFTGGSVRNFDDDDDDDQTDAQKAEKLASRYLQTRGTVALENKFQRGRRRRMKNEANDSKPGFLPLINIAGDGLSPPSSTTGNLAESRTAHIMGARRGDAGTHEPGLRSPWDDEDDGEPFDRRRSKSEGRWDAFYRKPTGLDISNPYASNLGSLYMVRFTPNLIMPDINNDSHLSLRTLGESTNPECDCDTVVLLKNLYDLTRNMPLLRKQDLVALDTRTRDDQTLITYVPRTEHLAVDEDPVHRMLQVFEKTVNPVSRIGRAIPYTATQGYYAGHDASGSVTVQREGQEPELGSVFGGAVNHSTGIPTWRQGYLTNYITVGPFTCQKTARQLFNVTAENAH